MKANLNVLLLILAMVFAPLFSVELIGLPPPATEAKPPNVEHSKNWHKVRKWIPGHWVTVNDELIWIPGQFLWVYVHV